RGRPRTVVEGEDDFIPAQEIVLPEMLESETGAACRIDLDHARRTERLRIACTLLRPCRTADRGRHRHSHDERQNAPHYQPHFDALLTQLDGNSNDYNRMRHPICIRNQAWLRSRQHSFRAMRGTAA